MIDYLRKLCRFLHLGCRPSKKAEFQIVKDELSEIHKQFVETLNRIHRDIMTGRE